MANQPDCKYLAIRNWSKYQSTRNGQPSSWIKDYVDKDHDYDYGKLTGFQRYVYDGCRRLRGKFGRNFHYDATWVARALNVLPTERARVANAIATLVARGLLIPTNQQDDVREIHIEEKRREEKRRVEIYMDHLLRKRLMFPFGKMLSLKPLFQTLPNPNPQPV